MQSRSKGCVVQLGSPTAKVASACSSVSVTSRAPVAAMGRQGWYVPMTPPPEQLLLLRRHGNEAVGRRYAAWMCGNGAPGGRRSTRLVEDDSYGKLAPPRPPKITGAARTTLERRAASRSCCCAAHRGRRATGPIPPCWSREMERNRTCQSLGPTTSMFCLRIGRSRRCAVLV